MGNRFSLRRLWPARGTDRAPRRRPDARAGDAQAGDTHEGDGPAIVGVRGIDLELIIEAARLVVTTRAASKTLFIRHLHVSGDVAEKLLARLEHCQVIAPTEPGRTRRVVTTSGQLPGVIAEFERRG